jgi:peptidyl-prolyl cis-trans isomerase C
MDVARINGVALHAPGNRPSEEDLRQRACTELLRQAAQRDGLLPSTDAPCADGAISEAAAAAIDAHIERAVHVPPPSDAACRRHFAANARAYATGERLHLRHILFAVTPGVDVALLRRRAEAALLELRCDDGTGFPTAARTLSNCPSGAEGGDLGWLGASDCASEFAKDVFTHVGLGVLPRLIHSRFGLHIVEVLAREPGAVPGYESVRDAVAKALMRQGFVTALRQYLSVLAGAAELEGVDLEGARTPLVQ